MACGDSIFLRCAGIRRARSVARVRFSVEEKRDERRSSPQWDSYEQDTTTTSIPGDDLAQAFRISCFFCITEVMDFKSFWQLQASSMSLQQGFIWTSFCLLSLLYVYVFSGPLAKIPGPLSARLSRYWMIKHSWKGDMHRTMIDLHNRHGKLVRTGPNEVSVSDLAAIKQIHGAGTKFRKSDWYSVWQGHRKFDLFAERDERIHGAQRRLVSRIYSMESPKGLEEYINDAVMICVTKLKQRQGTDTDIGLFVQLFAFGQLQPLSTSKHNGRIIGCSGRDR